MVRSFHWIGGASRALSSDYDRAGYARGWPLNVLKVALDAVPARYIRPGPTARPFAMSIAYRFGSFELHPSRQQLLHDGRPVPVGQRALDVLAVLVERPGEVVRKDQLIDRAWPGLVVEENNLAVQVSSLRRALGPDLIATVPGLGYRFTADVTRDADAPGFARARRHNLPSHATSFVGHEEDLREYAALVGASRLLTLTGIGGCGKTRLALELANVLLPSFRDGVWFVDLAAVADAERLPLAVAQALEIRQQVDSPTRETISHHLAPREALLLLDNCEHLTSACADLAQWLLDRAPQLRILATSREGLSVAGERTVTVRSLATPGAASDIAAVQTSEAVRLFVERARAVDRGFAVDAANAGAVAEICRRLDGIPLAIELAAARVKVLSVDEIRGRLNDRFRLLTGTRTGTLPRQQTLLATIKWAFDHLCADEQRMLALLSVFAGGWTLAAAVHVIGEGADDYIVLDALGRLVDRSLVVLERLDDGTSRYAMLETVRQYAQERLDASGEGAQARDRHLDFYLALARGPEAVHSSRGHALWQARLRRELENLLQALAWSRDAARGELALVNALDRFWFHSGLLDLGYEVTRTAVQRASECDASHVEALLVAASLAFGIGRNAEGNAHAEAALATARRLGDALSAARATRLVAYAIGEEGDTATALSMLEESLSVVRRAGDPGALIFALNAVGELHRSEDNLQAARPLYEEALAVARKEVNIVGIAHISDNLARLLISCGMAEAARDLVRDVLVISNEAGSRWIGLCALDITAALAAVEGDWLMAARVRGAAEARVGVLKHRRDRADASFLAPWTDRIREALPEEVYRAAFEDGYGLPDEAAGAEALAWLDGRDRRRRDR